MEALWAVMILSVSLVVMIHSILSSTRALGYNHSYFPAAIALENKLEAVFWGELTGVSENKEGVFGLEPSCFSFGENEITQDDIPSGLKELQLKISWKSGKKNHELTATTYFLKDGLYPY